MWEGSEWISPGEGAQRLLQEKIERDRLADSRLRRVQVMADLQVDDLQFAIVKRKVKWIILISFLLTYLFALTCICFVFAKWAF